MIPRGDCKCPPGSPFHADYVGRVDWSPFMKAADAGKKQREAVERKAAEGKPISAPMFNRKRKGKT